MVSVKLKVAGQEMVNRRVSQFFACLADETRLKILSSLMDGPKTVGEMHFAVGKGRMSLSAVSHQLRQLSDVGVVFSERRGKSKMFQLSDRFCWCMLRDAFRHFNKELCVGDAK